MILSKSSAYQRRSLEFESPLYKKVTYKVLALRVVQADGRHDGTLVHVVLAVYSFKSFRAVASNGGRFGQVSAGGAVQAAVVDLAVVDGLVAGRAVETVRTLTPETVGLQFKIFDDVIPRYQL